MDSSIAIWLGSPQKPAPVPPAPKPVPKKPSVHPGSVAAGVAAGGIGAWFGAHPIVIIALFVAVMAAFAIVMSKQK